MLKTCLQRKFPLRPAELLHLSCGVLAGMEHIASKGCIHLDLAARNCLLGENNVVKVATKAFGLFHTHLSPFIFILPFPFITFCRARSDHRMCICHLYTTRHAPW